MARIKKNDIAQNGDIIYPDITIDEVAGGTDLKNIVSTKANIAQEGWTEPTLINGFTNGTNINAKYYVNSIGEVSLTGGVENGSVGAVIFVLPAGYSPSMTCKYYSAGNSNTASIIQVDTAGNVLLVQRTGTLAYLNEVRFRKA